MTAAFSSNWKPWRPSPAEPWNLRRVVHLHRRAAFAATWNEIQRDLSDGPDVSIDRLLAGESGREGVPEDFASMARVIGDSAVGSSNIHRLQAWWIYQMIFTPDPLGEKLVLMWHNHFATSNLKVANVGLMRNQNESLRTYARGPFAELLDQIAKDPAMLIWLDADANRKGKPNENLAREIMELFTLGVGNYSEADIKQAARALTGWTVKERQFQFDRDAHDDGEKTIFGERGKWDGDDLLGLLIQHDATPGRLAFRVCEMLMGEDFHDPSAVAELADGLRNNELKVSWAVETVLRSEAFMAAGNIGNRVLAPIELVVGTVRALELFQPSPSTLLLAQWASKLGQSLFIPPNVFGWPGGRSWLTSRALVGRANFAAAVGEGKTHRPAKPFDPQALAVKHERGGNPVRFLSELLWGHVKQEFKDPTAILASPQAQLG